MPETTPPQTDLMTIAELLQDAEPCSILEDAQAAVLDQRSHEIVDRDFARMNDAWSRLAHQVVGQERF